MLLACLLSLKLWSDLIVIPVIVIKPDKLGQLPKFGYEALLGSPSQPSLLKFKAEGKLNQANEG